MNDSITDRQAAYLWNPGATVDPEVAELERRLAPLRFDASRQPVRLPSDVSTPLTMRSSARSRGAAWTAGLATAAVLVLGIAGFASWRLTWPSGRAWSVSFERGLTDSDGLTVGETLKVPPAGTARIAVARIGTMRVQGGSEIRLRSTTSNRHRLTLDRGAVHVRIFAPPGSIHVQTPSGNVIDLGCEFELEADPSKTRVRVLSGWVQLVNVWGEVLVPAGASAEMFGDGGPLVPVYNDASAQFRTAVRTFERSPEMLDPSVLEAVLGLARKADVLTLFELLDRNMAGRDRIVARAAELLPPLPGVEPAHVIAGDRRALWRWRAQLKLPPVKGGWWRNWRDGLPDWLRGSRP